VQQHLHPQGWGVCTRTAGLRAVRGSALTLAGPARPGSPVALPRCYIYGTMGTFTVHPPNLAAGTY